MTRPALPPAPRVAIPLVFSLLLATPAVAQGTAEQREACTSDAIRLCPDTIPDLDRTTACMKAHEVQLSRRCHRVFSAETEAPAARSDDRARRTARASRGDEDDVDTPRRRSRRSPEEYDASRDYGPSSEDAYATRGYGAGSQEGYAARGYGPGPDDGYGVPRGYAPGPDAGYAPGPQEEDDTPRRAERVAPESYAPYGDGYGPRRYLYMTPRGQAETPDDAD